MRLTPIGGDFKGKLAQVVAECEAQTLRCETAFSMGRSCSVRRRNSKTQLRTQLLDQAKHLLALEGGRRDTSAIDRLLDADLSFERTGANGPRAIENLDSTAFDYLIQVCCLSPGRCLFTLTVAPVRRRCVRPWLSTFQGQGVQYPRWIGGRSSRQGALANGDQNERILRRQFEMIDAGKNIDVVGEWDMQWYRRFCKYQKKGKYDLVVIDSLDGCNDSNPYEENRREFAAN